MIISMRRCVACDDLWPWPISSRSFDLDLENRVRSWCLQFLMDSFYIWHKWSLSFEGVSRVTFFSKSGNLNFWQIFYWFRQWLVAWLVPSHYLNQCWNIVNWTLRNKLQWNFNRNSNIFIQENTFENVVWKIAAILSLPQCINLIIVVLLTMTCNWAWHYFFGKFSRNTLYFTSFSIFTLFLYIISTQHSVCKD